MKYLKSNKKMKHEVKKIVTYSFQEIEQVQKKLIKGSINPKNVHNYRIKIRRLRGTVSFLKPLFEETHYVKFQKELQIEGLRFSNLREYDVLLSKISLFLKNNDIFDNEPWILQKIIEEKRETELKNISETMDKFKMNDLFNEIEVWIDKAFEKKSELSVREYLEKEMTNRLKKTKKAIDHIDTHNLEEIHKVRIRSKKMRYILEGFKKSLTNKNEKSLKKYQEIQEDLGFLHDIFINKELLEKIMMECQSIELAYEAGQLLGSEMKKAEKQIQVYR